MLIENQKTVLPLSGLIHLRIKIEDGIPSVESFSFEECSGSEKLDAPAKQDLFHSRLLAVVERLDRGTTAIDALAQDFRALAGGSHEDFYAALQLKLMGRERLHLARRRSDVYLRSDLAREHSIKLSEGWFLGTNISNREKVKFLHAACALKSLHPVPMQFAKGRN